MAKAPGDSTRKKLAAPLQTHHVFLDTQVYRKLGHNPKSPPLVALQEQIEAGRIILHMTDITLAEIERQLRDYVAEAAQAVKAARKQVGIWKKRLPKTVSQELPVFDQDAVAKKAFWRFRKSCTEDWQSRQHVATAVSAFDVFQSYFRRDPPFHGQGSKEFPDAFVVRALENWCSENGERMYVIGADKAMAEAVKKTSVLLPMGSLDEFLEGLAATETPGVVSRTTKLLDDKTIRESLQAEIAGKIDELIPVYTGDELADGEVTEHELAGEIEIVDFTVLAASDEEIRVTLEVRTPLLVTVSYEDRTFAFYDKEEDAYFGGETADAEIESAPVIRVFAKLRPNPPSVAGLQIMTGEINVQDTPENYK
jgi:hypothetical protein